LGGTQLVVKYAPNLPQTGIGSLVAANECGGGRVVPGWKMSMRFDLRSVTLVVVGVFCGQVCDISGQVQTPPVSKAVGSSSALASASSKPTPGESSSNPKAAAKASDPSSADTNVAQDLTVSASKGKPSDSYIVGVADSLFISVWKEPDFSGPVVVRPDGIITLPVVGDIHVVGMTTLQVQDLVTEKLKPIVTEPQVTVIVRDISSIRSRKVYLVGKVGRPGTVSLTGNETVLQVIAESGGPGQFAKPDKMYILRAIGNHETRIPFHYKKVLAGSEPDLELVVGDVIVVP
jgi:polysaccharide biosynthesis/export protein